MAKTSWNWTDSNWSQGFLGTKGSWWNGVIHRLLTWVVNFDLSLKRSMEYDGFLQSFRHFWSFRWNGRSVTSWLYLMIASSISEHRFRTWKKSVSFPTPPLKIIINNHHLGHSTESKHSSLLARHLHIMFTNRDLKAAGTYARETWLRSREIGRWGPKMGKDGYWVLS